MDRMSHDLIATAFLKATGFRTEYSFSFSMHPDCDLKFLHRWRRHRFSVFHKIYGDHGYNLSVPTTGPVPYIPRPVALVYATHFLSDMFNGPIWCFGLPFPTSHIPKGDKGIRALVDDLRIITYPISTEPTKLHQQSAEIFENTLKKGCIDSYMWAIVMTLYEHTPLIGLNPKAQTGIVLKRLGFDPFNEIDNLECYACVSNLVHKYYQLISDILGD